MSKKPGAIQKEILQGLGETLVKMRITLSYFIEPGPGEIGWGDRYRYPSHALRFKVNGPTESKRQFVARINAQASDEEEHPHAGGAEKNWVLGEEARNVGSIHSDIWQGTAAELAASSLIAVYPCVGWWRERRYLQKWDKKCRYSLVVSIHTPTQDVDIYTAVRNKVGIPIPISISTNQ